MTREQWRKHKKAIKWFYEQPEGTEIWCKSNEMNWYLTSSPFWDEEDIYVINDKFSEIRRAIVDGKTIQYYSEKEKWVDLENRDYNGYFDSDTEYRIKPEVNFPIFKKNDFMVVKFENDKKYRIEFIFNYNKFYDFIEKTEEYPEPDLLYFIDNNMSSFIPLDDKQWKDVLYDEERELWDRQPVFVWDDNWDISRNIEFYDAKNKCALPYFKGEAGLKYDNYEPYPHLTDKWIIEDYNKLKFDD